jgi:hypothetical protein
MHRRTITTLANLRWVWHLGRKRLAWRGRPACNASNPSMKTLIPNKLN